ncbi:MAG: hypothetical protein V8S13_06845 [Gemmiger formicilis]
MDPAQLAALSKAAAQLEDAAKEQDRLEEELRELKNGTLMSELTTKQAELQEQESQIKERLAKIQTELLDQTKALESAESDVKGYEENWPFFRKALWKMKNCWQK